MNNIWIISFIFILCLIAGIITFKVLKEEEEKQKRYKNDPDSAKGALERSHEYEQKSLKSNVTNLSWIYVVAIIGSLIAFFVYMF